MRNSNRVTLYLDCSFYNWMEQQRQEAVFSEMLEPINVPVEVGFTFNDGPCNLADFGRSVILIMNEGVKS